MTQRGNVRSQLLQSRDKVAMLRGVFFIRHQPTIRYNMRPRSPATPLASKALTGLAALVSLFLAWEIFRWIAL